jgi:hypothetical protein
MPWLLCGGACHLHHAFDPDAFAAQSHTVPDCALALPAAAVSGLASAGLFSPKQTVVALWRAPERYATARTWAASSTLVDVASFGEIGILAARRGQNGLPAPIPLGAVNPQHRAVGAPPVIETSRTIAGTLALRGRMVPFRRGTEKGQPPQTGSPGAGYIDTGFACRPGRDGQTLIITAPPPGTVNVGGYRFRQNQIEALVSTVDPDATIVALPDGDLGHRLAGIATPATLRDVLPGAAFNPLISGAFHRRGAPESV